MRSTVPSVGLALVIGAIAVLPGCASTRHSARDTLKERYRVSAIYVQIPRSEGHISVRGTVLTLRGEGVPAKKLRVVQANKSPGMARAGNLGDVFERVAPGVVVVRTTDRDIPETGERRSVSVSGLGSGILMSHDGKVLTAAHLVQTASEIRVDLVGGARVAARVIASEPDADVAVLQLERVPAGAVVARLGGSDRTRIGDEVFIVGAP